MITLKNVSKAFGTQQILKDFSCVFKDGEKYLICGESGIGKTTLLRMIMSLESTDSGSIIFNNEATFAVVFQEDRLIRDLSAIDNIALADPLLTRQQIRRELSEVLPEDQIDKPVDELSGGMKRRVCLVRALLNDGRTIILDEPFAGLDEENRKRALQFIEEHRNGRTILLCSHEDDDLSGYVRIDLAGQ